MMTRAKWTSVLAMAVTAAAWAGLATWSRAADEAAAKTAPDFTLPDQDGNAVSLSQFKGKIVVLEWLNYDCPVSRRFMQAKAMVQLADTYGVKNVLWLGINSTSGTSAAVNKAGAAKFGLTYTILDDHDGNVGHAYGARTTPHMFIIDPQGNIVYDGAIDNDPSGRKDNPTNYVRQALDELLAGKAVSVPKSKPYGCAVKYAQ